MTIEIIPHAFSVCKTSTLPRIDPDLPFCFTAKTDGECSLVCPTSCVPAGTLAREDGWRAFRVRGPLDFSLIGILADIAGLLAKHRISIFAVSTYDTDYILTREAHFDRALALLAQAGWTVA